MDVGPDGIELKASVSGTSQISKPSWSPVLALGSNEQASDEAAA